MKLQTPAAAAGTITLGGDLTVNRMGYGAMRLTGPGIWGDPADRAAAGRVLHRALDLGVNFIDTADAYGPETNERLIAECLHPYPAGLVIATKGGLLRPGPGRFEADGRPEHLRAACEASLKRLRLTCIDVYQLHTPDRRVPFEDSVGELARLQGEGKVRHIGLSNVSLAQLEAARACVTVVSVQNRYSASDRSSDDVLACCEHNGIAFIPWFPLAAGKLAGQTDGALAAVGSAQGLSSAQVALAWLLARSPVMLPIPGTSSIAHLEENVVSAGVRLPPAALR